MPTASVRTTSATKPGSRRMTRLARRKACRKLCMSFGARAITRIRQNSPPGLVLLPSTFGLLDQKTIRRAGRPLARREAADHDALGDPVFWRTIRSRKPFDVPTEGELAGSRTRATHQENGLALGTVACLRRELSTEDAHRQFVEVGTYEDLTPRGTRERPCSTPSRRRRSGCSGARSTPAGPD